jgi:hypothetical protein
LLALTRLADTVRAGLQKFCQILQLFLLTIPPNIGYIANLLAEKSLHLSHPRLPWRAEWFQNCVYSNPHIDAGVANVNGGRRNVTGGLRGAIGAGLSVAASAKIVEQQRSQVDEVFQSLKGGDDLEETHPGESSDHPLAGSSQTTPLTPLYQLICLQVPSSVLSCTRIRRRRSRSCGIARTRSSRRWG